MFIYGFIEGGWKLNQLGAQYCFRLSSLFASGAEYFGEKALKTRNDLDFGSELFRHQRVVCALVYSTHDPSGNGFLLGALGDFCVCVR